MLRHSVSCDNFLSLSVKNKEMPDLCLDSDPMKYSDSMYYHDFDIMKNISNYLKYNLVFLHK